MIESAPWLSEETPRRRRCGAASRTTPSCGPKRPPSSAHRTLSYCDGHRSTALQLAPHPPSKAPGGMLGGAAVGAMNSAGKQNQAQVQYNIAYQQCMYAKGNQVPSYKPIN